MAGEKTLGEFAMQMAILAGDMPRMTSEATSQAALLVTREVRAAIARDSGGDSKLSGVPARVGASFTVGGGAHPTALVKASGPMQLIESDTQQHTILAKGVGRTKGRSKAARRQAKQNLYDALFGSTGYSGVRPLRTPYGPRFKVTHPGTSGKKTWAKAIDGVIGDVPELYMDGLRKAVRRALR